MTSCGLPGDTKITNFWHKNLSHAGTMVCSTCRTCAGCINRLPRAVYKRVELCYTAGMKAYSQDLRQRVVRAVDAGQSQAEIAKTFAVSVATIKRYLKQRRETGHVLPKAIPGRPAKKGAVLQAHL